MTRALADRFLVVDLGGSQCRVALADRALTLHGRVESPTDHSRGPESVVDQIVLLCRQAAARSGTDLHHVGLVVVACPGPLDSRTGTVFHPPNLLGWGEVPLGALLSSELSMRAHIVNDANAAAFGEYHFGAGRGTRNMVYLTVSTGVGGGVVVNGSLLEGTSGSGGELGHMTIDRQGPPCVCGNVGCVEAIGSGRAIAHRYASATGRQDTWFGSPHEVGANVIAEEAASGIEPACTIFREAADAVGTAVVNCINVFNPEVVVLGGGLTGAGRLLFGPIEAAVQQYALPRSREAVRIARAELGVDVGLIGAAGLAAALPDVVHE